MEKRFCAWTQTKRSINPLGGHNFYLIDNNINFGLIKNKKKVGIYSPCPYTIGGGEYYISMIMLYFIKLGFNICYFNNTEQNIFEKTKKFYFDNNSSQHIYQERVEKLHNDTYIIM